MNIDVYIHFVDGYGKFAENKCVGLQEEQSENF